MKTVPAIDLIEAAVGDGKRAILKVVADLERQLAEERRVRANAEKVMQDALTKREQAEADRNKAWAERDVLRNRLRSDAACAAMAGFIAMPGNLCEKNGTEVPSNSATICAAAVRYADALLGELEKPKEVRL